MSHPEMPDSQRSLLRRLSYWMVGMGSTLATFTAIALLLVLALYLYSQEASSELERQEGVGVALPALELQPLTGNTPPLAPAELKGKVLLIAFWGPWCAQCRQELPRLADLAQELAEESDFRLVAISCGPGGPEELDALRSDTEAFLQQERLELPIYADPDQTTRKPFREAAHLQIFPTLYLVDRQGVIAGIWEGYRPGLVIAVRKRIRGLLEPPAETPPEP